MSSNLLLVEYEQTPDGILIEETAHIIEKAFIDEKFLEQLEKDWGFNLTQIHEEKDSNEKHEIKHLDDNKIKEIYDYLFNAFGMFIAITYKKLEPSSPISEVTLLTNNIVNYLDFYDVEKFRILTNLIAILKIKIEKYKGSNTVFLKIG